MDLLQPHYARDHRPRALPGRFVACGMVEEAAAPARGFEGPRQIGHSRNRPRLPRLIRSIRLYGSPWRPSTKWMGLRATFSWRQTPPMSPSPPTFPAILALANLPHCALPHPFTNYAKDVKITTISPLCSPPCIHQQ